MTEFVLKVIIPDEAIAGQFTVYLFDTQSHYIIPITTDQWACDSILLAKREIQLYRPHIHDSFVRTIKCLDVKVQSILIYKVMDDVFYAYLRIKREKKIYDLDMKVTDAICLSLRFKVPMYVERGVIERAGIKVTKDLILRSLELLEEEL